MSFPTENNKDSDAIEEEIIEEISQIDFNEYIKEKEKNNINNSKERVIVDEIEMFNDNIYWHLDSNLSNKELLNDIIHEFEEK